MTISMPISVPGVATKNELDLYNTTNCPETNLQIQNLSILLSLIENYIVVAILISMANSYKVDTSVEYRL